MPTIHIGDHDYQDVRQEYPDKGTGYFKRPLSAVKRIIIHHSATPGGETTVLREKATISAIYNYHTGKHLWPGIGYHAMVFHSGRVYITGGAEDIRYHAADQNGDSYGICLIGDFTSRVPSAAQMASTKQLVQDVANGLGPMRLAKHRDFGGTACPGDTWAQWIGQLITPIEDDDKVIISHSLNVVWGVSDLLEALKSSYGEELKDAVRAIKEATGIP